METEIETRKRSKRERLEAVGKGREASMRRQGMENDGLPVEGLGVIRLRRAAQQIWPWRRRESSWAVRPQFTVKLGKTKST